MPIPTAFDGKLGEINDAAAGLMVQLGVMNRCRSEDVPRMRQQLRDSLQAFVDLVMSAARRTADDADNR
jgi:hypothetical protein